MAFKIKQERIAPEVESARAKLELTLQCLIEKTEESPSTSEDEGNKDPTKKEPSPVNTPTKKPIQRTQRKRRRKEEVAGRNTNSYVMKLFDRAVDLAPFTEQDPLYPICRAWINNQSSHHLTASKKEAAKDNPEEDAEKIAEDPSPDEIHQLPKPKEAKESRIPSPVPQPVEKFLICSDEQEVVSKDLLMANHLQRWKAVRRKWKQAARANEDRYRESGVLLKSIFDK